MRMFAAVFPPLPVRRDIAATLADLDAAEGLHIARPENLHLTLAFFGERAESSVRRIEAAMAEAATGTKSFAARAANISGFPASDRARVLFVGLQDGALELSTLHDRLIGALPPDLKPVDADRFRPHLTFARPRKPLPQGQFEALQAESRPWSWQFEVDALHLVRSEMHPGGARYSVVASSGLGG
jgi:2'-5' RNA ligase